MAVTEVRIMPGMVLAYDPDGRGRDTILVVSSLRRAKAHTTARLRGFSGNPEPGRVWAIMDYSVKFPDHMVRSPFRVLTGRDILPVAPTCDYHDEHDHDGQPVGKACGEPATHIVWWPDTRQWSPGCDKHVKPEAFDEDGPTRIVRALIR